MKYDKWIPVLFLLAYMIRLVAFGVPSMADSFVVLFLSALYGWRMYLDYIAKPDPNIEIQRKLTEAQLDIAALKNSINVVKLSNGVRNEKSTFKF